MSIPSSGSFLLCFSNDRSWKGLGQKLELSQSTTLQGLATQIRDRELDYQLELSLTTEEYYSFFQTAVDNKIGTLSKPFHLKGFFKVSPTDRCNGFRLFLSLLLKTQTHPDTFKHIESLGKRHQRKVEELSGTAKIFGFKTFLGFKAFTAKVSGDNEQKQVDSFSISSSRVGINLGEIVKIADEQLKS